MEYAEVGKSGTISEGIVMTGKGTPTGPAPPVPPPPPLGHIHAPGYGTRPRFQIPKIPVYMDEDEKFVDYRKPGFWAYPHSIFGVVFGIVLLVLFTAGGLIVGFLIGILIFAAILLLVRRMWRRTGYWFTNHKIVIHDGSRIRLVPYDEIALSTLSFEGENCMFNTVYNQEVILKGIIDMEQVVAFISRSVKEARKDKNGGSS